MKPVTRIEQYYNAIGGGKGAVPKKPITRQEQLLDKILKNGGVGGGGVTPSGVQDIIEENVAADTEVDELLDEVFAGSGSIATDEEVNEMLDDVFDNPESVSTDEEVSEMLDDIFGKK